MSPVSQIVASLGARMIDPATVSRIARNVLRCPDVTVRAAENCGSRSRKPCVASCRIENRRDCSRSPPAAPAIKSDLAAPPSLSSNLVQSSTEKPGGCAAEHRLRRAKSARKSPSSPTAPSRVAHAHRPARLPPRPEVRSPNDAIRRSTQSPLRQPLPKTNRGDYLLARLQKEEK